MCTTMLRIGLVLALCGLVVETAASVSRVVEPPPGGELRSSNYSGMFELYDANRQQGLGNYITVDFVLTAYSLCLTDVLTTAEEDLLYPTFRDMTVALARASNSRSPSHQPPTWPWRM